MQVVEISIKIPKKETFQPVVRQNIITFFSLHCQLISDISLFFNVENQEGDTNNDGNSLGRFVHFHSIHSLICVRHNASNHSGKKIVRYIWVHMKLLPGVLNTQPFNYPVKTRISVLKLLIYLEGWREDGPRQVAGSTVISSGKLRRSRTLGVPSGG